MLPLPFSVTRQTQIAKTPAELSTFLADFSNWQLWSPWLCQEPDCSVTITGTPGTKGHKMAWQGQIIGEGEMELCDLLPGQSLAYDLRFFKPWRSQADVSLMITEKAQGSSLAWSMTSRLPFFLFFLRPLFRALVAMDYERGLAMLREYLETGILHNRVEHRGTVNQAGFHYVALRRQCEIPKIETMMEEDFGSLHNLVARGNLPPPDGYASFYHRYDIIRQTCLYSAALIYRKAPQFIEPAVDRDKLAGIGEVENALERGEIPAHLALQTDHIGPWRHLGNGWVAAMNGQRMQKRRRNKKISMYEIYQNDPQTVAEADIRTAIFIPVKSGWGQDSSHLL